MKKESIESLIDRKLHQSMVDGIAILAIKSDLSTRKDNMLKSIMSEKKYIEMYNIDAIIAGDIDKMTPYVPAKLRYLCHYIKHANRRIKDLDWITSNKSKFPRFSNSQVFNLIKLKDKLSI